jgi:chromosomal replication initiator protein DnaA
VTERRRLGTLLVEESVITQEQLDDALQIQRETGEILGNILVERGFVEESKLLQLLARHYAGLQLTLAYCRIGEEIVSLIPPDMARELLAMPISATPDRVVVAMANPMDNRTVQAIASQIGRRVWPVLCPREALERALDVHYGHGSSVAETAAPAEPGTVLQPLPQPFPRPPADFTFEAFVVGDSNRDAYRAAEAAGESPGTELNPLLIYGEAGHGKTHLLCAVGNRALLHNPSRLVAWFPATELERELTEAIEDNRVDGFHARYGRADVLLLDDIHFLARGRGVQQEFARLFGSLCSEGGQIAATSDRPVEELDVLVDDIRTRFSSGAAVRVNTASFALKTAILMAKQKLCGTTLTDELVVELATNLPDDIRHIEGALRNLAVRLALSGEEPTPEVMRKLLGQMGAVSS